MNKNKKDSFNKRNAEDIKTPAPMQVIESIIEECRLKVERQWKRRTRQFLQPLAARILGLAQAGEGFQWGLSARAQGARVGRYVFIGSNCRLSGPVSVGDLTMFSTNVTLVGDDHLFDDVSTPMRIRFPTQPRPATIIEADCWIGHGAIIREGLTIKRGTVVAAGAVVTSSTAPYSIVAGVPARLIRKRFSEESQLKHDILLYGKPMNSL